LIQGWVCHLQILAGPHQHVHSRVQAPRDSWPYFTKTHNQLLMWPLHRQHRKHLFRFFDCCIT
jgi:hypothetical protein